MKAMRFVPVVVLGLSSVIVGAGSAGAASAYVCSGGDIPSGTYSSVSVTGICYLPSGTVTVQGNLSVAAKALFDALTPAGYGGSSPAPLPGIITVGGNVTVGRGAVLFLGCNQRTDCPSATTFGQDIVSGSLTGHGALGVVVHGVTFDGNVSLSGGGGGSSQLAGGPGSGDCDATTAPAPWASDAAQAGSPVFSDFEDNSIGRSLSITGMKSCWMGALRNVIAKNLIDRGNKFGDADADEVAANTVSGNITCEKNNHAVQFGDSDAAPNVVSGSATGESAFGLMLPDGALGSEPISEKPA